jgi:hypothetical protein
MLIVQRRRLLLYPSYVQDYLDRVTAADVAAGNTQGLELGVTDAFNTTLQNLVGDSVLGVSGGVIAQPASTIKAMPFMAGARTLQGCLVPVVGPAPTSFNFVDADYNRKTGLVGNGSTKYLNSNRNNNADPQNSNHNAVFVTSITGGSAAQFIGSGATGGVNGLGRDPTQTPGLFARSREGVIFRFGVNTQAGFIGHSRPASTGFSVRHDNTTVFQAQTSATPDSNDVFVFRRNSESAIYLSGRLAFYSIGESLNLALLDARVTALINAIAAAIP